MVSELIPVAGKKRIRFAIRFRQIYCSTRNKGVYDTGTAGRVRDVRRSPGHEAERKTSCKTDIKYYIITLGKRGRTYSPRSAAPDQNVRRHETGATEQSGRESMRTCARSADAEAGALARIGRESMRTCTSADSRTAGSGPADRDKNFMDTEKRRMKERYIADLRTGEEITDFFMIKAIAIKTGSNRKAYLDLTLGDRTGEISAKKWDVSDEEYETLSGYSSGDIVKIRAKVNEWNKMQQLIVSKMRHTGHEDGIQTVDYIKAAPEPPEEMYDFIMRAVETITDPDLKKLCRYDLEKNRDRLMYYPAASKNHHAERSGLLWHIKRMLASGIALCGVYTDLDRDLVITGVVLHDMEKLNEILSDEQGVSDGYSFEGMMIGHIVQGVRVLDAQMTEMGFPHEKKIMVEHMILSHHYEPEYGSPKRPLFPEAELLHYLDIIDARMYDMEEALEKTEPGGFSQRVWTLENRRIYRRKENKEQDADGDDKDWMR